MSVMKVLDTPETVYTPAGRMRVTHEAYSYVITPFTYPPIKVLVYKGRIDRLGAFQPIPIPPRNFTVTSAEFKELLNSNPLGKPAGDFRLSDIQRCLKKRDEKP